MATRAETNVVYAAGLVQGIVLVTFPAASTIFTDPDEYDLSKSQYGAMFLPQVVTAIAGALLGSGLAVSHPSAIVFASIQRWFPTGRTYHVLPFVLVAALLAIASLPEGSTAAGVSLPAIFAFAAVAAGALAVLSFVIARPRHHVAALHPRPA